MRKENPTSIKRELSDHLDTRASNPIHVNNLKSLFGIEKNINAGELPAAQNEEQEMERIESIKSGSRRSEELEDDQIREKEVAEDSYQGRQIDFDDQNAPNITQKSTFSNNLFQLQKKDAQEMHVHNSQGFESNAAKQDVNESFNTAKEEGEDVSGALKKDSSMDVPRRQHEAEHEPKTLTKKAKAKSQLDLAGMPHGRAQSEAEADDTAAAVHK